MATNSPHFEGTTESVSDLRHSIMDDYYTENQEALLLYSKGNAGTFLAFSMF